MECSKCNQPIEEGLCKKCCNNLINQIGDLQETIRELKQKVFDYEEKLEQSMYNEMEQGELD